MLVRELGARAEAKEVGVFTALHCASAFGRLQAFAALIGVGAQPSTATTDGKTALKLACGYEPWVGGAPAEFRARAAATVAYEPRRWLLHARTWLYIRERQWAAAGLRQCYGCARARPQDAPGSGLCPAGCGGVPVPPAEDGVHEQWFCSPGCYAAAAPRHTPVCAQGRRWAATAAARVAAAAALSARPTCGQCGARDPAASCSTAGVVCQRCKAQWYCKVACANKAKAAHFETPACQARHTERAAARAATCVTEEGKGGTS